MDTQITVQDFVDAPELALTVVVDGDMHRPVSWVHVTELLDPSPYLEGGEFILSAGVWNDRGGDVGTFVGALGRRGVVALGWGLLAEDASVPEEVADACRTAGLPLVSVPTSTPFIAIERKFFEYLQRRRETNLRRNLAYSERLIRSISSLPGGLRGVLEVLQGELQRDLWLERREGRVVPGEARTENPPEQALPRITDLMREGSAVEVLDLEDATAFPVGTGEQPATFLVVAAPPGELDVRQRAAIEQAIPLLEFVLAHEQELRQAERRLAAELVEAVLSSRVQFATGRIRAYGLDPRGLLTGITVKTRQPETALSRVQRTLSSIPGDAVVTLWQEDVVAIFQPARGSPDLEALGRALHDALGADCAIGIGSQSAGVENLRRSLIQAEQAASLARRRPRPEGYVVHDRVESQALLLALQDEDVLGSFREAVLGPILEYDARRNTGLLKTLDAFISSGGQWQATARRLHIHVNTLRHRLTRCESLTGRNLSKMEDRVDFYLALRAGQTSSS